MSNRDWSEPIPGRYPPHWSQSSQLYDPAGQSAQNERLARLEERLRTLDSAMKYRRREAEEFQNRLRLVEGRQVQCDQTAANLAQALRHVQAVERRLRKLESAREARLALGRQWKRRAQYTSAVLLFLATLTGKLDLQKLLQLVSYVKESLL